LKASHGIATTTRKLHGLLQQSKPVNVLVTMKESHGSLVRLFTTVNPQDRGRRIESIAKQLQGQAAASQKNILNMLNTRRSFRPVSYESLWASNQIILRDAPPAIIKQIQAMDNVLRIEEETFISIEPVIKLDPKLISFYQDVGSPQWGIKKVEAPTAWAKGITGENIIVGVIDTGVRGSHKSLRDNYVGKDNYGWFDPVHKQEQPYDNNGHGTHVTGTILGQDGIGVAPAAKWMACKGCMSDLCSSLDLATCLQFMACPTNSTGGNPNCSKAPHIVSNSWSSYVHNPLYQRFTETLKALGIVVVFAAGNQGPFCSTLGSPGDYDDVISVGASTSFDMVAAFSSAGPSMYGRVKPDVVAPGHLITSAGNETDSDYITLSGSSMACPHAAGIAALVLSKNQDLSPDQVRSILTRSTEPATAFGLYCGGINESNYPNNHAGYGRLNSSKALDQLTF